MRTPHEVGDMLERLEGNLWSHGWDASLDASIRTLYWALGQEPADQLERYMARPDANRRREWIARGGDPAHWPDKPAATA